MADILKKLYVGKPSTSSATLYTVPTGAATIIKSITLCNSTASAATVTLTAGGQTIVNAYPVDANDTVVINDLGILAANDTITGLQGTSGAISVWISGMEVS